MTNKLKRGQKRCSECQEINAARQRVCKSCGIEFVRKNVPIKGEILEWQKVEIGAKIQVINGTGPYYISSRDSEEASAGERVCMGSIGVFKVVGVDDKGIHAHGATKHNGGYAYLYMGVPYKSKLTGLYYEPYRIRFIQKKRLKE